MNLLCLREMLVGSSILFFSISAAPVLAVESGILGEDKSDGNEVLQSGKTISGIVEDALGPITGANVIIKGSTIGVITDVDGKFVLENVPSNAILQVSFMGYHPKEVKVGNSASLKIRLVEDTQTLDEVVVVGYGTQKKVNLTGAVTQVTSKELENRPVAKATQMLQGVMPNVNITFSTAQPGAGGSVQIRGRGSVNGGEPLILIDGVPGDINRINPNDIESVSVLKDAAASAIYGARGAFGVVLVTTKNAKSGKMSITYNGFLATSKPTVSTDFSPVDTNRSCLMTRHSAGRRVILIHVTRRKIMPNWKLAATTKSKIRNVLGLL